MRTLDSLTLLVVVDNATDAIVRPVLTACAHAGVVNSCRDALGAAGHCTGWRAGAALADAFGEQHYSPSSVGAATSSPAESVQHRTARDIEHDPGDPRGLW